MEKAMDTRFRLHWDEAALAHALRIPETDVHSYFTDGRRASFLIERRLRSENAGWELAASEKDSYDLIDPKGGKWESRSVTRFGVYFTPSNQVGYGRAYDEDAFMDKLRYVKGFILSDIMRFPHVDVFVIPVENVMRWHQAGLLGVNAKVSRAKFWDKLAPDIQH